MDENKHCLCLHTSVQADQPVNLRHNMQLIQQRPPVSICETSDILSFIIRHKVSVRLEEGS